MIAKWIIARITDFLFPEAAPGCGVVTLNYRRDEHDEPGGVYFDVGECGC